MKRLLVIGAKLPRLKCVEWSDWKTENILDYQGILFDCRKPWLVSYQGELQNLLFTYFRQAHPAYLILPEAKDIASGQPSLTFIPYLTLKLDCSRGETLKLVSQEVLFSRYSEALEGHEIVVTPNSPQGIPWSWQSAIVDNVGRAVSGRFGPLAVLHAPAPRLEDKAFKVIIEDFNPDFDEPVPEPIPDWAGTVARALPGMNEIEARIRSLRNEMSALEEGLRKEVKNRDALQRWAEILWLDGIALQTRVSEALTLIGIQNESRNPTGHSHDVIARHGNCEWLIEVTGSTGPITIDKGRQLLQWIAEAEKPASVKGLLIGNAFRNHPPDSRPPTANHKIFVAELEDMARRFHFGLLAVRDLYRLVCAKLSGKELSLDRFASQISADGIVKFDGL